ncbi:MAG: EscU/YscU/HrcU family type III secretion system export apparatus switch protein [Planctomycetes bacterium]|nr:EscU/YscU/HrcU family type III secretion system export apparatus switch protein [Planctomycetota bacterium]
MRSSDSTARKLACALRYDGEAAPAPRVTAKGWGRIAEKIMDRARQEGIPLHHDAVLARLLSAVDVSDEIPEELYRPVAEVLAAVYRAAANSTEQLDS